MAEPLDILSECAGFEWDEHNSIKNWQRHGVTPSECEEIFFNRPLVVAEDAKHSAKEARFYALGAADSGRRLFIVFTVRRGLIRVVSAREMSRKERGLYEAAEEDS
ncbi:MAG: BrnT family toxin [Deltaproteobacteria bacterium]